MNCRACEFQIVSANGLLLYEFRLQEIGGWVLRAGVRRLSWVSDATDIEPLFISVRAN